jgi:hypothetical protein
MLESDRVSGLMSPYPASWRHLPPGHDGFLALNLGASGERFSC